MQGSCKLFANGMQWQCDMNPTVKVPKVMGSVGYVMDKRSSVTHREASSHPCYTMFINSLLCGFILCKYKLNQGFYRYLLKGLIKIYDKVSHFFNRLVVYLAVKHH